MINDLLIEYRIGNGYSAPTSCRAAADFIEKIRTATGEEKDSDQPISVLDQYRATESSSQSPSPLNGQDQEDERPAWFASWFKDKLTIEDSIYHVLNWQLGGGQTCFLGDSNSLLLSPDFFTEALTYVKDAFPTLNRLTIYGRTKTAATKDIKDLRDSRKPGCTASILGWRAGMIWSSVL